MSTPRPAVSGNAITAAALVIGFELALAALVLLVLHFIR